MRTEVNEGTYRSWEGGIPADEAEQIVENGLRGPVEVAGTGFSTVVLSGGFYYQGLPLVVGVQRPKRPPERISSDFQVPDAMLAARRLSDTVPLPVFFGGVGGSRLELTERVSGQTLKQAGVSILGNFGPMADFIAALGSQPVSADLHSRYPSTPRTMGEFHERAQRELSNVFESRYGSAIPGLSSLYEGFDEDDPPGPPQVLTSVAHCDLSDGNVMVDDRGRYRPIDFERARAAHPAVDLGYLLASRRLAPSFEQILAAAAAVQDRLARTTEEPRRSLLVQDFPDQVIDYTGFATFRRLVKDLGRLDWAIHRARYGGDESNIEPLARDAEDQLAVANTVTGLGVLSADQIVQRIGRLTWLDPDELVALGWISKAEAEEW